MPLLPQHCAATASTADPASSRGHRLPTTHDAIDVYRLRPAAQSFDTCRLHLDRVLREIRRVLRDEDRLTIAAFRRGDGAVARARADLRQRLYGVDSFTPAGLMQRLEAAGFAGARCLHAAGIWLIVAAETHTARSP